MNDTNAVPGNLGEIPGINLLPEKWRGWALLLIALSPYLSRAFYAVKNGGGIKGMIAAVWIGTNTPKPTETKPPTP